MSHRCHGTRRNGHDSRHATNGWVALRAAHRYCPPHDRTAKHESTELKPPCTNVRTSSNLVPGTTKNQVRMAIVRSRAVASFPRVHDSCTEFFALAEIGRLRRLWREGRRRPRSGRPARRWRLERPVGVDLMTRQPPPSTAMPLGAARVFEPSSGEPQRAPRAAWAFQRRLRGDRHVAYVLASSTAIEARSASSPSPSRDLTVPTATPSVSAMSAWLICK